ncbi:MAG: DUF488 domain-containing protein [Rhodospirillales bacterium]|nr:DUF488 domain-containing protein [Rhodospirillales bacterium]
MANPQIKRVYERRSSDDGLCVLVDRVWPRGISKEKLGDVVWFKDVAPSTELRKWFNHRPERWKQFCARYAAELDRNPDAIAKLRAICVRGPVTLLYSARDVAHNQALVLAEYLGAHR